MGLRIVNNIAALNAHRWLGIADTGMAKSLERLSSGYRINRAADDAAGLAISSTLRAHITSYRKASENASQANAMVQVAEGAMNEVNNILTRLKELATQASSANTSSTDRTKLDNESDALMAEIDRIANSTKYGTTTLINGNFGAAASIGSQDLSTYGIASASKIDVSGIVDTSKTYTIYDATGTAISMYDGTNTQIIYASGTGAQTLNFSNFGVKITLDSTYSSSIELNAAYFTVQNTTQSFQIGTANNANDRIAVAMDNMQTIKLNNGTTLTVDLTSVDGARSALDNIETAISYVAEKRGNLGAYQNRLGFAVANLSITIENMTAAESVIRDVDMAAEMTSFTKNQILVQSSTAMLAQANMSPQSVLSLMGG
ncbi:MAG: flagellin [Thermodesulfobacteriota bacterium]